MGSLRSLCGSIFIWSCRFLDAHGELTHSDVVDLVGGSCPADLPFRYVLHCFWHVCLGLVPYSICGFARPLASSTSQFGLGIDRRNFIDHVAVLILCGVMTCDVLLGQVCLRQWCKIVAAFRACMERGPVGIYICIYIYIYILFLWESAGAFGFPWADFEGPFRWDALLAHVVWDALGLFWDTLGRLGVPEVFFGASF